MKDLFTATETSSFNLVTTLHNIAELRKHIYQADYEAAQESFISITKSIINLGKKMHNDIDFQSIGRATLSIMFPPTMTVWEYCQTFTEELLHITGRMNGFDVVKEYECLWKFIGWGMIYSNVKNYYELKQLIKKN